MSVKSQLLAAFGPYLFHMFLCMYIKQSANNGEGLHVMSHIVFDVLRTPYGSMYVIINHQSSRHYPVYRELFSLFSPLNPFRIRNHVKHHNLKQ